MTYDALPASKDAQRRNLGHFIDKYFPLTPPLPTNHLPPSEKFAIEVYKYFKDFQFFCLVLEAKMENILKINFGLYN